MTDPAPEGAASTPLGRALRFASFGGLLALAIVGTVVISTVGPYFRDDMKLDRIVRTVALDWRDFDEGVARQRLQLELDKQDIGYVADSDCAFSVQGPRRVVMCTWDVEIALPVADYAVPLAFKSRAEMTADGDLR